MTSRRTLKRITILKDEQILIFLQFSPIEQILAIQILQRGPGCFVHVFRGHNSA